MSTVTAPSVIPTPKDDAMQLHRAFKGLGCDTKTVVSVLAYRNSMQRAYLRQEYAALYKEDLVKRISSELSGDLKKAMVLWMYDPAGCDATIVKKCISDPLSHRAATEVICSRTSIQIHQFKQAYFGMFSSYLEHDVDHHASGNHKKLLRQYLTVSRYEGPEIDNVVVDNDAKSLYQAGEKIIGTDEKVFIRIFSERSRAHLAAVDHAYHRLYGKSLEKAIKKETSGLFQFALLSILMCATNPAFYFAKVLRRAMKGVGTDESTLTRVIVTRAEIDMYYIKYEYQKKYGKSLHDAVESETSGHYKKFLLALLGSTY